MFTCFSISPLSMPHPGIAVATVRAGGVGILDREYCNDSDLEKASPTLNQLISIAGSQKSVGLRLRVEQLPSSQFLLELLNQQPHWLILCRWNPDTLPSVIDTLPPALSRRLLLEVTNVKQVSNLADVSEEIDGLIAKGSESGGWGGNDSAFILLQKLLQLQCNPIYIQGGIGVHTAAACRAAGASGVVLDDQLWLMPESPLPKDWQKYLYKLGGQETTVYGERLGAPVRVLYHPNLPVAQDLKKLAEKAEIEAKETSEWEMEADQLIGWGSPSVNVWPVGQTIGFAESIRDRYRTIGKFIQALLKASEKNLEISNKLQLLRPESPLAVSHKTQYPIVQGPMTRVSDVAEFANAVSQAGALPMLALALMQKEQVDKLLQQTKALLDNRSWGVGILGFVPHALREQQLEVVRNIKPAFALIAGGRPDQAAKLEKQGIATYIHVPTPGLLSLYLSQGAKRLIFEGRECGGHVGPLSSFVLWESAIEVLLENVPSGKEQEIHVLFAGGIHDACSAAMVSAMAAPLAERGMKIGVLMGSAYLFTQEAVNCGAIVKEYQHQALACKETINLETGPGHASRCAVTPFAQEFYETRRRMLLAGNSSEEIKNTLEDLTLGRLRVAAKGLKRNELGIASVDKATQLNDGMYMIGQVATLREDICTAKDLHESVSCGGVEWLQIKVPQILSNQTSEVFQSKPSDIAIIGIGTLLPKAQDPDTFWENIISKVNAITEIPPHRWDWRLYYDTDRRAKDKVYSKWGGFLDDVAFDPIRFGIPPKSLKSIEPMQLLALEAVRRVLVDAGYESADFDRENTSVILGASGGLADLGQQYATRSEIPRMVEKPDTNAWERLPEWTEESFPGLLFNVTAGRIANRFDLGGANYTVDAACASSLAAIDLAVSELEQGRCNVAIAGGVDTVQSPFAYFCFSKTQALSPRGVSRSFDQSADGIVISEGVAVVMLKRLADAERDGDKIYAVIKGVASSSDGKGLSMTAPASAGQKRAFHRSYRKAGLSPRTLGLYEAHGTGTVAGDRTELETVVSVLKDSQASPKSCVLGSVKTMIGHTKSSAGIVALVKAALSLHYKVLPPHSNVEKPLENLLLDTSPVYLLQDAHPWLRHPDYPRRAGVSAFGFGGTNFHAVLEEYQGEYRNLPRGTNTWPQELLVWKAPSREALSKDIKTLRDHLLQGANPKLRDLAYTLARQAQAQKDYSTCLCLVVENLSQLTDSLTLVLASLAEKEVTSLPPHIYLHLSVDHSSNTNLNKIAFLFPGQVAQYPGMAKEIALYFSEMAEAIEIADRQMQPIFPKLLSQYIYPPSAYSEAEKTHAKYQLTNTHIALPAIGAIETGYLALLNKLGLKPDMVAGHSYGEYAALYAAGALTREEFLKLSEIRGRVMATACDISDGTMAAVQLSRENLLAYLQGIEDVIIANHNAPLQAVISGKTKSVQAVVERLQADKITVQMLPVSGAFHSHLIETAQIPLTEAITSTSIALPDIPVYSNVTASPYESDVAKIRHTLSKHLLSPVEFVAEINAMYEAGVRTFIEVGPKQILTRLVSQILQGKEYTAVSLDGKERGLKGLLDALGILITKGIDINLLALYEERHCQQLDLFRLGETIRKIELPLTTWLVSGGSVRSSSEAIGVTGKIFPLNLDTVQELLEKRSAANTEHTGNNKVMNMTPTQSNGSSIVSNGNLTSSVVPTQSTPSTMSQTQTIQPNPGSKEATLLAYQAYQLTMREFLKLQEEVMKQFLSSVTSGQLVQVDSIPFTSVTPVISAAIPHSVPQIQENQVPVNSISTVPSVPFTNNTVVSDSVITARTSESAPIHQVLPVQKEVEATIIQEQNPNVVAVTPTSPQFNMPSHEQLIQILLDLVSDRTGYPKEMLGLDQDMEADLGIDSIKRVEIFGTLLNYLPETLAATVQSQMETLTQAKSLNGVVNLVLSNINNAGSTNGVHSSYQPEQETTGLGKLIAR
jgi:acyl transferase domain-containing protein/NAD(P)H-dependent flavin oxidoreductase YrpB (nitropropane dioxygenase family)